MDTTYSTEVQSTTGNKLIKDKGNPLNLRLRLIFVLKIGHHQHKIYVSREFW